MRCQNPVRGQLVSHVRLEYYSVRRGFRVAVECSSSTAILKYIGLVVFSSLETNHGGSHSQLVVVV